MSKKNMIMPPVVLACVCAVCCGLLAFANSITKDKIAAAEAQAVQDSLSGLPDAGTFEEITDFTAPEMEKVQANALYADENNMAAVLVTADGYNKGGLQVAVGIDSEGKVTGVSFVSVTETPGLGTKVQSNPELLVDDLIGMSSAEEVDSADGITGATFSSKGTYRAVTLALDAYNEMEGVTVSE